MIGYCGKTALNVNYFGFSIAVYFEGERNHLQSGRFYYRAGEHSKVSWDGGR